MAEREGGTGRRCLRCGDELVAIGEVPFRIGGAGGLATAVLGAWAEAGESHLKLWVLSCPGCGEVTFVDPEMLERDDR